MNMQRVRPGLAIMMLACAAPDLSAENVTLSTYYPSPSGIYTQVITTGRTSLCRDGGTLSVGTATPVPGAKLDVEGTGGVILNAGNVSINKTTNDGYPLDVNGSAKVSSDLRVGGNIRSATLNTTSDATIGGALGAATLTTAGDASVGGNLLVSGTVTGGSASSNVFAGDLCTTTGGTTKCLSGAVQAPAPTGGVTSVSCPADWNCSVSGTTLIVAPPGNVVASACPAGWNCSANPQTFRISLTGPTRGPLVYQCPDGKQCCSGGAWGYYGCTGQITTAAFCSTIEYPCSCTVACTPLGHLTLTP